MTPPPPPPPHHDGSSTNVIVPCCTVFADFLHDWSQILGNVNSCPVLPDSVTVRRGTRNSESDLCLSLTLWIGPVCSVSWLFMTVSLVLHVLHGHVTQVKNSKVHYRSRYPKQRWLIASLLLSTGNVQLSPGPDIATILNIPADFK